MVGIFSEFLLGFFYFNHSDMLQKLALLLQIFALLLQFFTVFVIKYTVKSTKHRLVSFSAILVSLLLSLLTEKFRSSKLCVYGGFFPRTTNNNVFWCSY